MWHVPFHETYLNRAGYVRGYWKCQWPQRYAPLALTYPFISFVPRISQCMVTLCSYPLICANDMTICIILKWNETYIGNHSVYIILILITACKHKDDLSFYFFRWVFALHYMLWLRCSLIGETRYILYLILTCWFLTISGIYIHQYICDLILESDIFS